MNNKNLQKILTEDFLIQEYIINEKPTCQIAREIKCSYKSICKYLRKFNIRLRSQSENTAGENNPMFGKRGKETGNYKDGRTNKKYYCIDCDKQLSKTAYYHKTKRCYSCNAKFRILQNPLSMPSHILEDLNENLKTILELKTRLGLFEVTKEKMRGKRPNILGKNNPMFGIHRFGKDNPNWKNGITPSNVLIRGLEEYQIWREKIFARDNYTCQDCEDNTGGNLEAHHIKPFAKILSEFLKEYDQFSPIEDKETLVRLAMKWKPFWNTDNGKTLCDNCHNKINRSSGNSHYKDSK